MLYCATDYKIIMINILKENDLVYVPSKSGGPHIIISQDKQLRLVPKSLFDHYGEKCLEKAAWASINYLLDHKWELVLI